MIPCIDGKLAVPPGFRFHPTDEELLYYYLRKKVAYEAIDLDVIRDVDLNKLEPWDLKEKCRIGSGPQNECYFFSHKDKKYPTGTRTNRATMAGFWKATGRDKAINLSNSTKRIGMRKTLVFYTGRAPHGQKTDWIMHEYRLDDESVEVQEDGWVVCRVFMKKNQQRGIFIPPEAIQLEENQLNSLRPPTGSSSCPVMMEQNKEISFPAPTDQFGFFNASMQLPQLLSSDHTTNLPNPNYCTMPPPAVVSMNSMDLECSHNLMKLTSDINAGGLNSTNPQEMIRFNGDWSILDKLLASHQNLDQLFQNKYINNPQSQFMDTGSPSVLQRIPNLQYLGCESTDHLFRISK